MPPEQRPSNTAAEQSTRKRRRKTAAGGATDDCFTCRNRGVKCDRKRPYCTPCIDIGQECSGYKTTLTWGVGIASRGKMRGMSCPVPNETADVTQSGPTEAEIGQRRSLSMKVKGEDSTTDDRSLRASSPGTAATSPRSISAPSDTQIYTNTTESSGMPSPIPEWQITPSDRHGGHEGFNGEQTPSVDLSGNFYMTLSPPYDGFTLTSSGQSVSPYTESDFYTPMEHPNTPANMPFSEPLPRSMSNSVVDQIMTGLSTDRWATDYATIYSNTSNIDSSMAPTQNFPAYADHDSIVESNRFTHALYNSTETSLRPMADPYPPTQQFESFDAQEQAEVRENEQRELNAIDIRFNSTFYHTSPRLQSLMQYYSRNVCPNLVAFDGAHNPYRKHVLHFALGNEGLQNAIAALATNNIRMRKMEPQSRGFLTDITRAFDGTPSEDNSQPTAEEAYYKKTSIDQLNMQLIDIRAAQDDSVLATLLILCLFHVCDSGFSRFKTQLAGVQKLLSLRNPGTHSDFTRWVEMFFTWFDVMTSSVNDREMQIGGESIDLLDSSPNLGTMEQYSGCDGRLFKLISKLGRLNLIAQGRAVRDESTKTSDSPQNLLVPQQQMMRQRGWSNPRKNKSLSAADYENIDGNGWGSQIISSDREADGLPPDFISEWYDLRTNLQGWQIDSPYNASNISPNAPSDPAELEAGQSGLMHINEAFRYAALLYVERLGYPLLSSHENQFQYLVSQALYHITAISVTSCFNKFLLWPLFVIGSECVDENHRSIVRIRCIEIQKESGFYNNITSLEVLEKVWAEDRGRVHGSAVDEADFRRRDAKQAFRWRRAMDKADGEYIVV